MPELFDTSSAFCLVSESTQDGHALLAQELERRDALEAEKSQPSLFDPPTP